MVAVDLFLKWVEACSLKGENSGWIVAFIEEEIIARHGYLEQIISDGGLVYASREIEVFYKSNGI